MIWIFPPSLRPALFTTLLLSSIGIYLYRYCKIFLLYFSRALMPIMTFSISSCVFRALIITVVSTTLLVLFYALPDAELAGNTEAEHAISVQYHKTGHYLSRKLAAALHECSGYAIIVDPCSKRGNCSNIEADLEHPSFFVLTAPAVWPSLHSPGSVV